MTRTGWSRELWPWMGAERGSWQHPIPHAKTWGEVGTEEALSSVAQLELQASELGVCE